jgi:hypothetical protein
VTSLQAAGLASLALAATSAIALARRRAQYVPAAVALVLLAAGNLAQVPILDALRGLPRPIEGDARVLVYIDGALSLSYYAIVAGLPVALAVSPERRRRATGAVVAVWFAASVVLGALYPSPMVRGASLQRVYFDADLIGLFVATVAIIVKGRANIAAKESPDAAFSLAVAMTVFDAGILLAPLSPWRTDLFADYFGPQLIVAVFFAVVTAVQVILWALSTRRT